MRWKIIAGCTAAVLCICVGLWLKVQHQQSASGATNLLHIYSDQQNVDANTPDTTGGVQPSPPAPQPENNQPSKSSGTQNKPNTNTSTTAVTTSETITQPETEEPEPETSTTPEATFSIIGSEGDVTATLEEGDTVYSVTEKMMEGYPLPDFDYGEQGLWEYSINGEISDIPASEYVMQNGDVLEWHPVLSSPAVDVAPSTSTAPSEPPEAATPAETPSLSTSSTTPLPSESQPVPSSPS